MQANLVLGNGCILDERLHHRIHVLSSRNRSEVHVLGEAVISFSDRYVSTVVRILHIANRSGRESESFQEANEEVFAIRRLA